MQTQKIHPLSKPLTVFLLAAVSCMLWGSASPVIKIGYQLFGIAEGETWRIILFAGMRFSLAGALVILFSCLLARRWMVPRRQSWGNIVKLGLAQTVVQYMLFYIGVANASGVHSAILSGAGSLWAILLSCFLFRQERMTLPKLAGCLLSFGGIVLMNLDGAGGGVSFRGEGFLLIAGLSSGLASGLCKNYSQTEDPVILTGWQFLLGGLFMCLCALLCGARLAIPGWAALGVLIYLSFLSAVAYSLWTLLLRCNDVSTVSVYGFITPLFGVFLSALLLGEFSQALSPAVLVALVMVSSGIVIVNRTGFSTKIHK